MLTKVKKRAKNGQFSENGRLNGQLLYTAAYCILYSAHYTLYILHTAHSTHFTKHTQHKAHTTQSKCTNSFMKQTQQTAAHCQAALARKLAKFVHRPQTLHNVHNTLHTVQCTYTLTTVHNTQHTVHTQYTLYTKQGTQKPAHCRQHTKATIYTQNSTQCTPHTQTTLSLHNVHYVHNHTYIIYRLYVTPWFTAIFPPQ